jgi:hypothetical protein
MAGLLALVACSPEPTPAAAERQVNTPSIAAHPPTHIDSFVPRDEALRRFRQGLAPVDGLTHGLQSRDALVHAFVRALESRDSAALRRLVLSRAEFAYLYYPSAPQGLPPYDLNADLMWFTLSVQSAQGMHRALDERGGQALHIAGLRCAEKPDSQGENVVWGPCALRRVRAPADTIDERLFGPIVERRGRYKFLTYANKL